MKSQKSNIVNPLYSNVYEKTFYALGTKNTIRIFNEKNEEALILAVNRVFEINDRMSAYVDNSDISKIKKNRDNVYIRVHKDTYDVIRKAVQFGKRSEGAFDITIRPLTEMWGISKKGDYVPLKEEINQTLNLVSYKDILFNKRNRSIKLRKYGQSIDLGGIAKGYAADEVKRILKEKGIKSAVINLGGNIITLGTKVDKSPWRIGIQHPLKKTGETIGTIEVKDKTIVTSAINERFFMKDGTRYHHIINPKTGNPAKSGLLSVTVVSESSINADALTTAIFVLGMEKGIKLVRKEKGEAVFINEDLSVYVTNGLTNNFKLERV